MHNSKNTYYAILVSLGGFLFGFDASVISGVVHIVAVEWSLSAWQQGLVVSAPTLAAIASALFVAPLADQFGRKPILLTLALIYLSSAVLSAIATDFVTLTFARALGGLAFGSLGLAPIYIAEISPPHKRGFMVSFNQMNIVVGFAASYFSNYLLLTLSSSDLAWVSQVGLDTHLFRWMLGMELIPATMFLIGALIIPESPRWLIRAGKHEQSQQTLKQLFPEANTQKLFEEIHESLEETPRSVFRQIPDLISPKLRLPLLIGLIVGVAQQITGINAIYFYAPSIFEQTGVGTNAAFAQAALLGVTNVIFTIIAMSLIDRLGRKPLLLIGLIGVFLTMSLASYAFSTATYELKSEQVETLNLPINTEQLTPLLDKQFNSDVEFKSALKNNLGEAQFQANQGALLTAAGNINSTLVLIAIIGFTASFAISLGPVMWCLFSEIFPNRSRGVCNALVGIFNSMASFVVQFVFPWELATFGAATTFMIFGLLSVVSFVLIAWLLPETRGKSLEELENVLGSHR